MAPTVGWLPPSAPATSPTPGSPLGPWAAPDWGPPSTFDTPPADTPPAAGFPAAPAAPPSAAAPNGTAASLLGVSFGPLPLWGGWGGSFSFGVSVAFWGFEAAFVTSAICPIAPITSTRTEKLVRAIIVPVILWSPHVCPLCVNRALTIPRK